MKKSHLNFYLTSLLFVFTFSLLHGQVISDTDKNREKVYNSLKEAVLNADKVYQLDLSSQELNEFPIEIFKLKKLEYLNLGSNNLTSIDPQIKDLVNLKQLILYNNKLKNLALEICTLTNLETVNISNNNLGEIPLQIGNLKKLKKLDISGNIKLLSLPETIWKLALEELNFDNELVADLPKGFLDSKTINFSSSKYGPFVIGELSEGKRILCKNGKMGVIESSGKIVMTEYDCLENSLGGTYLPKYHNGKCFMYKKTDDYIQMIGIMDANYEIIENPDYFYPGFYCNDYFDYKNGLYPLINKYGGEDNIVNWVFIDSTGKKVFECNYSFGGCTAACMFLPEFSEGFCAFENKQNKYGYLNTLGKVVIPPVYYGASNFSEGIACVIESKDPKHFYFSFIDKQGKKLFNKTFDIRPFEQPYGVKDKDDFDQTSYLVHYEFNCRMRNETFFNNGLCKIRYWDTKAKKEVLAIINTKGDVVEYIEGQY
jgi:hypothetical protein